MGKKRFTPEYKKEIIKLVTARRKKFTEVAKDIGVTPTSIRRWIKKYSEYKKDDGTNFIIVIYLWSNVQISIG